jgi:hypothetical protein
VDTKSLSLFTTIDAFLCHAHDILSILLHKVAMQMKHKIVALRDSWFEEGHFPSSDSLLQRFSQPHNLPFHHKLRGFP